MMDLPNEYKKIYKTIWEISQKQLIKLARARAPYICQSQSLNIYFANPTQHKLSASHIYAWKLGLKTGQYYLRSRPARDAIQFTLDVDALDAKEDANYNTKNLSKAEMDAKKQEKRVLRKRPAPEQSTESKAITSASKDLNKKRKITETKETTETKEPTKEAAKESKEAKPWEGKEEQEKDYRWDICENCQ